MSGADDKIQVWRTCSMLTLLDESGEHITACVNDIGPNDVNDDGTVSSPLTADHDCLFQEENTVEYTRRASGLIDDADAAPSGGGGDGE